MYRTLLRAATALWFAVAAQSAQAESLVFSTAPTHDLATTREVYQPLVTYLAETTGLDIQLQIASSYLAYSNAMQRGDYDIAFDGSHFVSWRMRRQGHQPIARLPGEMRVAVVVQADGGIRQLADLIGRKVCGFDSPNQLTMIFLQQYSNPAQQPVLISQEGFKGVMECLRSGQGVAALVRDTYWNKIDQTGLSLLQGDFGAYPERTFSVRGDLGPEVVQALTAALLSEQGQLAAAPLLTLFKQPKLLPADPTAYQTVYKQLAPLWGFD